PLTVEELFLLKTGRRSFWWPSSLQKADIVKALSHTQVESLRKQKIGQLSTGQLQRVFIAYALFGQPDLLLFDEPTAGIDIGAEMTVYNLLQKISREHKLTMMIVSHELNVVFRYATNVVCLNKRLACYGTPSEALSSEQLQKLYGPHTAFYAHNHKDNEEINNEKTADN
ncbi:MAG TPA: ATP-binding cassette domain-containing protein, partial [Actinobacteria bacterium]|nr:ATP-binding cassette domain-containing protein [Actinomycetes bacterium]HEX21285.1 ATP-binding cassette domain-containing protein [Actinomycetota bacterium]